MTHIMLDLETLDTASTAVVTAIGAVIFDPYAPVISGSFYFVTNDWAEQQKRGRTISGNTVRWWMEQSDEARTALLAPNEGDTATTSQVLHSFTAFLDGFDGDVELWGNGADFDNVILGSLYDSYGIKKPWSYSRNRCYRTMNSLPKSKHFIDPGRSGTHHNALDDAITQANRLQAIFAAQRKQP